MSHQTREVDPVVDLEVVTGASYRITLGQAGPTTGRHARMKAGAGNPFNTMLSRDRALVLDGGLATHLEHLGCVLDGPLWSARMLAERPEMIVQAHLDFLRAGADCIITSSYQATLPGLATLGMTGRRGIEVLRASIRLACEARTAFLEEEPTVRGHEMPIVAASVGPYGAFLADGSEYSGRYEVEDSQLMAFHAERWEILATGGADLLVCETIPSAQEARVLLELSLAWAETPVWMSFSCRDSENLWDGTPFAEVIVACDRAPNVVAVGVNCTAPGFISPLIGLAKALTEKAILVYPNSGERYDPVTKSWSEGDGIGPWGDWATDWVNLGARGVGGCCRVGPCEIAQIRAALPAPGDVHDLASVEDAD